MLVKLQFFRSPSSWFPAVDWLRATRSISARSFSSPTTPLGFRKLPWTSRRSPSKWRRTFAHAFAVSFSGSHRPSIGRLPSRPRSPLFAGASDPVGRDFRGVWNTRWLVSRPPHKSRQSSPTKLFTAYSTGSVETASECDSSDPAVEVLMVDTPRSPPGFRHSDGGDGSGDPSRVHEEYRPQDLTS